MASTQQHRCVFVGNIPYDATEEQLIQICEEVGPVVNFRLVIDRETGKPKGYGFCEYKDEETALSARRNLQGYEINGRQLRVDFAENDKGNDRNREQGRGGPGMAVNASHGYQQRPVGGPAGGGDSTLHQSVGFPSAMTAASAMAGVLGGAQSGSHSNGLSQPPAVGSDPLTLHLSQMSRSQLTQVLSDVKVLATHNRDLARQLLLGRPQLSKALFQSQIMLGMVTPQMLQTPNIRQGPTPKSQPLAHTAQPIQQSSTSSLPGLPPIAPLPLAPQSLLAPNQFSAPMQHQPEPPQPRIATPNSSQIGAIHQTTGILRPGSVSIPPALGMQSGPQMQGGSSVRPVQSPLLQNPGQMGAENSGHSPPIPKSSYQASHVNGPTLPRPGVQASTTGYSGTLETHKDTAVLDRVNTNTTVSPASSKRQNTPEPSGRPSKLPKVDDGRTFTSASVKFEPKSKPQSIAGVGLPTPNQISRKEPPADLAREGTQLEIPPDTNAALLQQVLKLTPEQLSALPPEQQQQVFQLQKMLMQSEKR